VSASARTDAFADLIGRDAESELLDELIDGLPNAGGVLTAALAHLIVDEHGFAWLPEQDFVGHFAADVDPVKARVQCAVQQGLSMSTFDDVMGVPAWKSHPAWYMVSTNDEAIPPDAERMFAQRMGASTLEVGSGHLAMVSHPGEVVELIEAAAAATVPSAESVATANTTTR